MKVKLAKFEFHNVKIQINLLMGPQQRQQLQQRLKNTIMTMMMMTLDAKVIDNPKIRNYIDEIFQLNMVRLLAATDLFD